jgi:hypothetical protein
MENEMLNTDELLKENARLREQLAEMLPWAAAGANYVAHFESSNIGTLTMVGGKVIPLLKSKAVDLAKRIHTGEFREVNQ